LKRYLGLFLRGAGMGAADAVPGVSGGTIAFVTGIYEELIHTVRQFGPSAFVAWRRGGWAGLARHLNLAFLLPLLAGLALSLISVAHVVVWLLEDHPLLLDGFFFGLVAASALVVSRHPADWRWWHLLPLVAGLLLAHWLPSLMPLINLLGNADLMLLVGGAIAISALLLPGVSGSFLLLTMGLYGPVMQGIRSFDPGLIGIFGIGCLIGLFFFSRLLSWLLQHHRTATLQLLVGFIVGSLPVLWPWQELVRYQLGSQGQMIPLDYRYLMPDDYARLVGESAQVPAVIGLALFGAALVLLLARHGARGGPAARVASDDEGSTPRSVTVSRSSRVSNREEGSDA
jgi:putative membrane protein